MTVENLSSTIASTEHLKEQVRSLPAQLRNALERSVNAEVEMARLETQIRRVKEQAERDRELQRLSEDADEETDASEDDNSDSDLGLVELEFELKRTKLGLNEAEDKAELEVRSSLLKATESHVKAAVGTYESVRMLRVGTLEAEHAVRIKKVELTRERKSAWEARVEKRQAERRQSLRRQLREAAMQPDDEELIRLEDAMMAAQSEAMSAETEVETIRAMIQACQMLTRLEGLGR